MLGKKWSCVLGKKWSCVLGNKWSCGGIESGGIESLERKDQDLAYSVSLTEL